MTPPAAAAAAAPAVRPRRPLAPARPLTTAPRPRRVSGPARRELGDRPRRGSQHAGIALGLIEGLRSVSRHRLLDRLIGGRTWIGIVAFALIGIVTLQLGLLKLNAGIGHALERSAVLQRENATLSIENSELASGSRVESNAARQGMEVIPAGALRFLTARPRVDPGRGASALNAPPAPSTTAGAESSSGASGAAISSTESSAGAESPASSSSASPASSAGSSEEAKSVAGEPSSPSSRSTGESSASARESTGTSASSSPAGEPPSQASPTATSGAAAETSSGGGTRAGSSG